MNRLKTGLSGKPNIIGISITYRWELKYYEWRYKKMRHLQNWFQEKGRYWRNWFWLLRHFKGIREGKNWKALYFLISNCCQGSSNINKTGLSNWQAIIPIYGKNIAQAVRQGLKSFWRTYNPLDDIDKPDETRIQVGLTGLTIAIIEGLEFSDLSESEATIAAAYFVNEINILFFPSFLLELAEEHPQPVRQVLLQYIQWQWQSSNGEYYSRNILRALRYTPSIKKLVIKEIFQYLLANDPLHQNALREALMLFLNNPDISQDLSDLAAKRINTLSITEQPFLIWLIAWFHVYSKKAVEFLKSLLDDNKIDNPDAFVEQFCAAFYQESPIHNIDWKVTILEQLIILVCQYIRFDQDIYHEGTYTPNTRDRAQSFRDYLFSALAQSSDREAYQVLNKLADNPLFVNKRDWILKLATDHAQREAKKRTPW